MTHPQHDASEYDPTKPAAWQRRRINNQTRKCNMGKSSAHPQHDAGADAACAEATTDVGVLVCENRDYLRLTVEPKSEPLRRFRISLGNAEGLHASLGALIEMQQQRVGQTAPMAGMEGGVTQPAGGWLPIETAPRDGTWVIGGDGQEAWRCRYLPYKAHPTFSGGEWCTYDDREVEPDRWLRDPSAI